MSETDSAVLGPIWHNVWLKVRHNVHNIPPYQIRVDVMNAVEGSCATIAYMNIWSQIRDDTRTE